MHAVQHIIKIITHLMEGYETWVELKEVKPALKIGKLKVQEALKPGKVPGGAKEDNVGVAYDFPDAKV